MLRSIDIYNEGITLIITDYKGRVIASNKKNGESIIYHNYWQKTVLDEKQPYHNLTSEGIITAHPIIINKSSEGAVITFASKKILFVLKESLSPSILSFPSFLISEC